MSTRNAPRSNNGARPGQTQAQTSQSIKVEQFTDIGMCVLVCDWKLKPLLERMIAREFSKMSDGAVAGLAENLPEHIYGNKRDRLSRMLKQTGLGGMKESELREYIRNTLRWSLHELQCVVEALDEDKDGRVGKLRDTRNNLVHKDQNFNNESERNSFLDTYNDFITNFDFMTYFGTHHAESKKKECRDLSLKHKELMTMLSKYRELEITLKKEIANWEDGYNKMKKQRDECEERYKQLMFERDQLKKQVEETETELEEGIADRTLLEQQLSEKDKEMNKLKQQLTEVTKKLRRTEEELLLKEDALKEKDGKIRMLEEEKEIDKRKSQADYTALYKDKEEAEHGQSLLLHDVSERDDTITELSQKLVNIERERIILQNYFDFQTGSNVVHSGSSLQFSPLQPQAQKLQSTEWEQLTDTELCMLVCDSKVKDLLEQMIAHALLEMSDEQVALMAEKLPKHVKADARRRLREKLKKTGLGGKNEEELKDHIRKTMGLYQLQSVAEVLGEDEGGLVGKLRNKRNDVVHKNYKFKDESEREKFLATYDEFIAKFNFEKYFGSFYAETKREECRQLSRKHEKPMTMLSEDRGLITDQESVQKLLRKVEEELQMKEDALKEKDKIISKLDQEVETLTNQTKTDGCYITEWGDENDDLKEQVETLNDQLSQCRCNMGELEEEMKKLSNQAEQDGDSITKLKEQIKTRDKQVEALEERLSRCRCNMDQTVAQVQTGELVDRRHTF